VALGERQRTILFGFTVALIVVVAVAAVITILRAWGGSPATETLPEISPGEISLCPGESNQFTVDGAQVTWGATGGTISTEGLFTAGGVPGRYEVTVSQDGVQHPSAATVNILACTPTAVYEPSPAPTPRPTAAPSPEPTAPPDDARYDVVPYDGGAPVDEGPAGVDIRISSLAPDLALALVPAARAPDELSDWATEDELLVWSVLYTPVPDPPDVYIEWLFALDLDGDTSTGRAAGAARINPDLGDEAVLGVSYDPASGEYVPYLLVWDWDQGAWEAVPDMVRYTLSESRTVIGLAVSLEELVRVVERTAGVTAEADAARGRAGVLSYVGEQAVIDFYPDRPD
jgi:hypothetical protein